MAKQKEASEFGAAIKLHRKRAGLSQSELAKMANVGKTLIFELEHGHTAVRFDALCSVLAILNLKLDLSGEFLDRPMRLTHATN